MHPDMGPPWWLIAFLVLVAGLVLAAFIYVIGKAISTAVQNRAAPLLERQAFIVTRRQEVWGKESANTSYYLTFQFPDGSREEFSVEGTQYGLLAEGDTGLLRSQGTWFKGFDRTQT